MKRIIRLTLSWLIVFAVCAAIFYFSGKDASGSSRQSLFFVLWFEKLFGVGFTDFVIRKSAHFIEYTALGFFAANAVANTFKTVKKVYVSVIFSFLYSLSDEFHQLFVPGRACQVRDVLIDLAGIAVGTGILMLVLILVGYVGRKKKDVEKSQNH